MALRGTAGIASTTAGTTLSLNVSGIPMQSGDIVLLYACGGGNITGYSTPTGFSTISGISLNYVHSGSIGPMMLWSKVASGADSSYSVTATGSADLWGLQCRVYSGRNTTSTFTATSTTSTTPISGAGPVATPLTGLTAAAGDDIVSFAACNPGSFTVPYTFGAPAGWANVLSTSGDGSINFTEIMGSADDVNASSGATGSLAATFDWTGHSAGNCPVSYAGYAVSLAAQAGVSPASYYYLGSQNFY